MKERIKTTSKIIVNINVKTSFLLWQKHKYSFIYVPRHATAILTPVLDLFHTAILFIFAMKERIQTTSKLIVNINVDLETSKSTLIFTIIFDVVLILSSMKK